jgi:type II secretory pathway pseudopilin PulG
VSVPRKPAGSALVEALVALVLIAIAGLVVASAAMAGLRATRRAAILSRTTSVAARELAVLAAAATAVSAETTLAVAGFPDPPTCATEVRRDGAVVALAVRVDGGAAGERVTLATRVVVDE